MTPSATATPHPLRTRRLAHCVQAAGPHQCRRPITARTRSPPTVRAQPTPWRTPRRRDAAPPPLPRINTTAHLVPCLHVGAAIQQQPRRRLVAVPCSQHDRRPAILRSHHPATTTRSHASRHHGRHTTACPPPTHRPVPHPRPGHQAQCPTHQTQHACAHPSWSSSRPPAIAPAAAPHTPPSATAATLAPARRPATHIRTPHHALHTQRPAPA